MAVQYDEHEYSFVQYICLSDLQFHLIKFCQFERQVRKKRPPTLHCRTKNIDEGVSISLKTGSKAFNSLTKSAPLFVFIYSL